jgi:hypothetical protein
MKSAIKKQIAFGKSEQRLGSVTNLNLKEKEKRRSEIDDDDDNMSFVERFVVGYLHLSFRNEFNRVMMDSSGDTRLRSSMEKARVISTSLKTLTRKLISSVPQWPLITKQYRSLPILIMKSRVDLIDQGNRCAVALHTFQSSSTNKFNFVELVFLLSPEFILHLNISGSLSSVAVLQGSRLQLLFPFESTRFIV